MAWGSMLVADRALRILVVDDNRDSAESLAMLLALGGHEVVTAHDGIAALELAQDARWLQQLGRR